jgi:hypothetical protein
MNDQDRDPWNQQTLRDLGARLVDARVERDAKRTRRRRVALAALGTSAGCAVVILFAVLILTGGHSAQALNFVNEAPAAAERSGSLRFRSQLTIILDGRRRPGIAEEGAIDFTTGDYDTTTTIQSTGQTIERRRVGRYVYSSRGAVTIGKTRWDSAPVDRVPGGFAYESDAFTDPAPVFRALAHISAPVRHLKGTRFVHGVPTTEYQLTTDLAAFLRPTAGHFQDARAAREVRATLSVWLDHRGRPRRVDEEFKAGGTVLRTTVLFSSFGKTVLVKAPPKSLVHPTKGAVAPNPLGAGPGQLLAPLLFFRGSTPPAVSRPLGPASNR